MAAPAISCGECSWPVLVESWSREYETPCLRCGHRIRIVVFPAIEHRRVGTLPEALSAETEASCFYHPQSRAAVPCEECGRFLCSLCDLEVEGRHLCPTCFQTGVNTRKLKTVDTKRTMYDSIALTLATAPLLLFWPMVISAPAALFVVVRRWRAPGSIVPRTRIRFYLAALFALAEIAGVGVLIWFILRLPGRTGAP